MGRKVVYVGSYTYIEKDEGLSIFQMEENGALSFVTSVAVDNASYMVISKNKKHLYSITDEGVVSLKILRNGLLERESISRIHGMRGSYISLDRDEKFMFVSGYYDGKITVLRMNQDGTPGEVTDSIRYRGISSVVEKSFIPHVSCALMTPDDKFLCVVDSGRDVVSCYELDRENGRLRLLNTLHCEMDSEPRHILFSHDGKNMYMVYEEASRLDTYSYEAGTNGPEFERLQSLSTLAGETNQATVGCGLKIAADDSYVLVTNAGDNSVGYFRRNPDTGLLEQIFVLPVSGDYPKDLFIYPDGEQIAVINRTSGTMTFFRMDEANRALYMTRKTVRVKEPSCILMLDTDTIE